MTTTAPVVRCLDVGSASVAYCDSGGDGPPLLLLHGCPFSKFVWRNVIHRLSDRFRCVAPDLLGLGNTETDAGADWSLPAQADAIIGLLDRLGLGRVAIVGHDQGGAIAQLIAIHHPDRVSALVLADAEAYDNWPSAEELPFIRVTQLPVIGPLVLWAWSRRPLFRWLALSTPPRPNLIHVIPTAHLLSIPPSAVKSATTTESTGGGSTRSQASGHLARPWPSRMRSGHAE